MGLFCLGFCFFGLGFGSVWVCFLVSFWFGLILKDLKAPSNGLLMGFLCK